MLTDDAGSPYRCCHGLVQKNSLSCIRQRGRRCQSAAVFRSEPRSATWYHTDQDAQETRNEVQDEPNHYRDV